MEPKVVIAKDLHTLPVCKKSSIYQSWLNDCPHEHVVVNEFNKDWIVPDDAGIVVTHMHYRWDEITKLREIYEKGNVPVLILADGILEYRNTWEHPDLADGAMFQPVIGHKLACIGRGQVRIVESWDNVGKCELVGLPRMDSLARDAAPVNSKGPFRLLIATATTPAFNEDQRQAVIDSLSHLRSRIDANPLVNGRKMEVTWRLTDGLEEEIGIAASKNRIREERPPLTEVIDNSDAVITTPSTLYLESLMRKRPTAVLDFHNSPQYVTPAWTINAPKHLNQILRELAQPPAPKMMFQEFVLNDQLFLASPSVPRLTKLVSRMIEIGAQARKEGRALTFPSRMLTDPQYGHAPVPEGFDRQQLYPDNAVFQNQDIQLLQTELVHAIKRLETMPIDLAEKSAYVAESLALLDAARLRSAKSQVRAAEAHDRFAEVKNRNEVLVKRLNDAMAANKETIERRKAVQGRATTAENARRMQRSVPSPLKGAPPPLKGVLLSQRNALVLQTNRHHLTQQVRSARTPRRLRREILLSRRSLKNRIRTRPDTNAISPHARTPATRKREFI